MTILIKHFFVVTLLFVLLVPISAQTSIWSSYYDKGTMAFNEGELETSVKFFRLAHSEAKRAVANGMEGAEEMLCKSLDGLGAALSQKGEGAEAESSARAALKIAEKIFDESDDDFSKVLNNIGLILTHQSKFKEAEEVHRRALRIREKYDSPPYRNLVYTMVNLGKVFYDQGKYDESDALLDRAFELFNKFGSEDVKKGDFALLAAIVHNQATTYEKQGRLPEAAKKLEFLISFAEIIKGKDSPWLIPELEAYAKILRAQKRNSLAAKVETRLKLLRRK